MKMSSGPPILERIFQTFLKFSGIAAVDAALQRRRSVQRIRNHFQAVINLAAEDGPAVSANSADFGGKPLISFVVPVYNTKNQYLEDLLFSFQAQQAGFSELVLSDDGSTTKETKQWLARHANISNVIVVSNPENRGIAAATNSGIACASGEWIGLLDHDDALAPHVVTRIVKTLQQFPSCKFLYTDEVVTDRKLRPVNYFLKPAWDPVLLSGVNYVNHLSLYRRDRLLQSGGLREGFEGSQDYDLVLRYTADLGDNEILHLPYPGYIWRRDGKSYTSKSLHLATKSARKALAERYAGDGTKIEVGQAVSASLHRVRFDIGKTEWPLVSVVIPSKDSLNLISTVLDGLASKTDYPALEIIVIDNGSIDERVRKLYERYRQGPISFRAVVTNEPFNFSRAINRGVAMSKGRCVLLLNNDIEVIEPGWLKEMVSCFQYPRTAIVGAKLLYPDLSIQHAGVIAGLGGLAGHWFIGRKEDFPGPMGRLWVRQSLSVVTGACMLLSRECIDDVGEFDEKQFAVAYNDVDYCLRAVKAGHRVVWTPFAKLIHHESASRGSDNLPENVRRFESDKMNLQAVHDTLNFEDRTFNPWYSKDRSFPYPVWLPNLPLAR